MNRLETRPTHTKGGGMMPALNYLPELDRINAKKALGPIIKDMGKQELRVALLYILGGIDIYEATDSAFVYHLTGEK